MAEKLTARSQGFSEWYVDLVLKAKLADYSDVKGCMVIRPNGYAVWENIQKTLDGMFKATGHKNAYFPLLIPESFLKKEAEHVEGFAPELAVVTHAGGKKLEEPYVIRPTSETIISSMFSRWMQSYRDLPLLINQWANVMRWEMRTRLFLRTTEFLWQEGHTATRPRTRRRPRRARCSTSTGLRRGLHGDAGDGGPEDREREVRRRGRHLLHRGDDAGQQGPAGGHQPHARAELRQGLRHVFQGRDGKQEYVWQTSWGVSTRLIGALVMTHSDDQGLIVPPKLAAQHVAIVPIAKTPEERTAVLEKANALAADLRAKGLGVVVDDDETKSPGFKFAEYELIGTCLRMELGPKDLAKDQCVMVRRDEKKKEFVPLAEAVDRAIAMLDQMQKDLFAKARAFRDAHTFEVNSDEELKAKADDGFLLAHWNLDPEIEARIKEEIGLTTRNRPFDLKQEPGKCVVTGEHSPGRIVLSKAY